MAHNLLRIRGLTQDVSNPYDPANIDTDAPLGMKDVSGDFVGKGSVSSLLPGETSAHYLTYDCHSRIKECKVGGDDYECVSCRSLGGGTCVKASQELREKSNLASDGVCIPLKDLFGGGSDSGLEGSINHHNPFTTVEEAYLQYEEERADSTIISSGGLKNQTYLTRKTGCINATIVRKDPYLINKNPKLEPLLGCTDIVMCGGSGVGAPVHPITGNLVVTVEDIDFDINGMASAMSCHCEEGFEEDRDPTSLIPFCKLAEGGLSGKETGEGCPVVFYTGDARGCLCDDSTQVRLEDVANIELADDTTDYGVSFLEEAKNFTEITERYEFSSAFLTRDACLPKPGVDPRMASLGYSYASSLFGLAPEITAFNGGHLMTGGLLRESAMDADGNWHSRIEDNEGGKIVLSESVGGVVPYAGTGSVAAHVWNGYQLNDNGLVGAGGGDFNVHPNASMRVVPLPHSSLPGLGIDSMDHSVGIVASQGRVYPQRVFMRKGDPHRGDTDRRGAKEDDQETSFLEDTSREGYDLYKNSPLSLMRSTHDSGICATAYVLPSLHRTEKEKPDAKDDEVANRILPLLHYRPLAKRAAHTPLETIFKHSVLTAASHATANGGRATAAEHRGSAAEEFASLPLIKGDLDTLIQLLTDYYFPNLNGEGKERSGGISPRSVFAVGKVEGLELREIGGLMVQPVTVSGEGTSSTFARFGEKILSANSPKIIDHYKVGPSAVKYRVDETEARKLFPAPPTAWRIATNEGCFFSGRGLNNGVEGTGMRESERTAAEKGRKPEVFSAAVMSGDGVLMNGESAPLLRPLEIPACSLPECTWFERRGAVNSRGSAGSHSNLSGINNAYAAVTAGSVTASLNATVNIETSFNTYSPAKPYFATYVNPATTQEFWLTFFGTFLPVIGPLSALETISSIVRYESRESNTVGSLHAMVPLKFHVEDDLWQQCKVTKDGGPVFIPPPMPLFESLLRVRTISSERFVRPELIPNRFRADWGLSPHTAGHYMNGIYSPPCVREETGQAYGYPCSGALSQYMTLMVPKPVGENSHSTYTRSTLKNFIDAQMATVPKNAGELDPWNNQDPGVENIFDKLGNLAGAEKCNCTTGLFCPKLHAGGRGDAAPIAALPSRGNRHARFALMSTMPKNDVHLSTALLRAQSGDSVVLDLVGKTGQNGKTESLRAASEQLWGLDVKAMVSPNRWSAFRRNIAYTPYSTRPSKNMSNVMKRNLHATAQPGFNRIATLMGKHGMADLIDQGEVLDDVEGLPGVPDSKAEILNVIKNAAIPGEEGARSRRLLDFFESAQGAAPSTFGVGSFAPHAEGARDIVAVYATPMYTGVSTPPATINEGAGRGRGRRNTSGGESATVVATATTAAAAAAATTTTTTKTTTTTTTTATAIATAASSTASDSDDNNNTNNNTNYKNPLKRKVEIEPDVGVFKVNKFEKASQNLHPLSREELSSFDVIKPERVDTLTLYEASKNIPRVMRRIHLMPINTPYHGGFECGQTPAVAANSRGVEFAYADFMKPPLATTGVTTSLEGVRIKAPEPFDQLSIRGFMNANSFSLRKFAHHHHYGYEGLMARNYYMRNREVKVFEGELKDRFPFVCQSDRGTFPPKRDGSMQPLALVDMGVLQESVVPRTLLQE